MEIIKNNEQYEAVVNDNKLNLIYFSRVSCGVCHAVKPQIEALAKKYLNISLYEVSIDQSPEISAQNTIFSVPAFFVYYQGQELMRQAGFVRLDQLEKLLIQFQEADEMEI